MMVTMSLRGGWEQQLFFIANRSDPPWQSPGVVRLLPLGKASPTAELTLSPKG